MSTESTEARRYKRIVEHIIGGFNTANEAVTFANTVEQLVSEKVGAVKFRQSIGAPNTPLAITREWTGPTVLKTIFLELKDQDVAAYVCDIIKKTVASHEEVHKTLLQIHNEVVREKPQPQTIGFIGE